MVGVDEVGRGCLAGPLLVVAARAKSELPPGLKDSKLLSRQQREEILNKLSSCCEFGEGWVKASEIDKFGLAYALKLGVKRALKLLGADTGEQIILDGSVNYIPRKFKNGRCQIKADNQVPIVSAASIYAKVTRDHFMIKLSDRYPRYKFDQHVGYGTAEHYSAIKDYGPLKYVHRTSFALIRQAELL